MSSTRKRQNQIAQFNKTSERGDFKQPKEDKFISPNSYSGNISIENTIKAKAKAAI